MFSFYSFFPSVIVRINLDFASPQSGWESPMWDDVSVCSLQVCYVIFSRQSPCCWMLIAYCSLHKSLSLHCKFRKGPLWAKLWEYKIVNRSVLFQGILNPREVESQERKNVVKSERMKPACSDRQDSCSIRSCEDQGLFSVPYLKSTCWNPNTKAKVSEMGSWRDEYVIQTIPIWIGLICWNQERFPIFLTLWGHSNTTASNEDVTSPPTLQAFDLGLSSP